MINGDRSDEVYQLKPNDKITIRVPDDVDGEELVVEVDGASHGKFMVELTNVPSWLEPGLTVSGEMRSPAGARYFESKVAWILPFEDQSRIMFHQPVTEIVVDDRRSTRVPMDIEATWSRLDGDMHPENHHLGRVHNLSATGMRLDASMGVNEDDCIVASLPLTSGIVNVIGTVLAIEAATSDVTSPQMRIRFSRLDDATWSRIVEEIAELAAMTGESVVLPYVIQRSLNRRAILAYATSDRRR